MSQLFEDEKSEVSYFFQNIGFQPELLSQLWLGKAFILVLEVLC